RREADQERAGPRSGHGKKASGATMSEPGREAATRKTASGATMTAALLVALVACGKSDRKDFGPRFFSSPGARVQCSKGVDRDHEWKHEALAASLETARDKRIVLHTYGHAPKLDLDDYLPDFDWAAANGVSLVTFRDLAAGHTGAGWAFTVDDDE